MQNNSSGNKGIPGTAGKISSWSKVGTVSLLQGRRYIFPKRIKRHPTFCWAPAKSLFFYTCISVPLKVTVISFLCLLTNSAMLLHRLFLQNICDTELLSDNLRISDDLLFLRNQLINFSEKDQIALSFVRHGSLQSTISGKNPWSTYKCWEESKMACLIQIQYTWKLDNINQQSKRNMEPWCYHYWAM